MFSGGLDAQTLADSNAVEIAALTATHTVPFEIGDERNSIYTVDFAACLKGFLSSRLPAVLDIGATEQVHKYVGVLRNFLNYLLYHDVCKEYKSQIEASRAICDTAEHELCKIVEVLPMLPGSFNVACSEIFGGVFQGLQDQDSDEWMEERDKEYCTFGLTPQEARRTFKIAFAAHASDDQVTRYEAEMSGQKFKILSIEEMNLEITG